MPSLIKQLKQQHQQYQAIFCRFEDFVASESWDEAFSEWRVFENLMSRHFSLEEDQLFKVMENELNNSDESPSKIFRVEHKHLLKLMQELDGLLITRDKSAILESSDLLMTTIEEHAFREEHSLFPMLEKSCQ